MIQNNPRPKNRRTFFNFLLEPFTQIKLGLYSNLLMGVFSIFIFYILNTYIEEFREIFASMNSSESKISELFYKFMNETEEWVALILVVFFISNFILSIVLTHRMTGPMVAFKRHIEELKINNFKSRVTLRKKDSFHDVALKLNELAETLEKNSKQN